MNVEPEPKRVHEGRRYRVTVKEFKDVEELPRKPKVDDYRVTYTGKARNVRNGGTIFDLERDDDHTLVEGLSTAGLEFHEL